MNKSQNIGKVQNAGKRNASDGVGSFSTAQIAFGGSRGRFVMSPKTEKTSLLLMLSKPSETWRQNRKVDRLGRPPLGVLYESVNASTPCENPIVVGWLVAARLAFHVIL